MRLVVSLFEAVGRQVGINLCGGKVRMAKEFLDTAQIGSTIKQVRGKTVPQLVWRQLGVQSSQS
jgi:hypothetical protein